MTHADAAAPTVVIRETPTPSPSAAPALSDPAMPDRSDEPKLDVADIQGNLLAGFNKDHVMLLFLAIEDTAAAKVWLHDEIAPKIAGAGEVLAFNRLFKSARKRRRFEGAVKATWINIAVSAPGLKKLISDGVTAFADQAFQDGLAARSASLNDSTGAAEGSPDTWRVGGPGREADVVLIVASDDIYDLYATVQHLENSIYNYRPAGVPLRSGVQVIFKQLGETQPGALAGHEHFGWLDGVSQPGLRGRLSDAANDLVTPRQNTDDPDQGKPGQDVLWPGEFIFGYSSQTTEDVHAAGRDSLLSEQGQPVAPHWARNGSYLVFRRLRQDVHAFHKSLQDQATQRNITPQHVGSQLVGRWPSGAPVMRSADVDNAKLGNDDCANNHFEFQTAVNPSRGSGSQCDDASYLPQGATTIPADITGAVCPFNSHIRKSYPRDDVVTPGQPDPYGNQATVADEAARRLTEADTQTHRLLRRGIPYGPSSTSHPDAPVDDGEDRGLLFMAYMTSIVDQFEFVTKHWVNDPNFKDPGVGIDPILGQPMPVPIPWVVPTGGGYFFAPPISALTGALTT